MKNIAFILLMVLISELAFSSEYWVPYVDTTPGPSQTYSKIMIHSTFDNTTIDVDFNHDGLINSSYTMQKGEEIEISIPDIVEGTHILTNYPVSIHYYYMMADYGAYEDGSSK